MTQRNCAQRVSSCLICYWKILLGLGGETCRVCHITPWCQRRMSSVSRDTMKTSRRLWRCGISMVRRLAMRFLIPTKLISTISFGICFIQNKSPTYLSIRRLKWIPTLWKSWRISQILSSIITLRMQSRLKLINLWITCGWQEDQAIQHKTISAVCGPFFM